MTTHYLVAFSDQEFFFPMTWDKHCDGALCATFDGEPPVLFSSRTDARKAIRISTAFARLCKEQGKPCNDDFLDDIKCVMVIPCVTAEQEQGK